MTKYFGFKPTRQELKYWQNPSEFKTWLKQQGFQVPRDFYKRGSIAYKHGRPFRFRWWGSPSTQHRGFLVDMGRGEFDRWTNSTICTWTIESFLEGL